MFHSKAKACILLGMMAGLFSIAMATHTQADIVSERIRSIPKPKRLTQEQLAKMKLCKEIDQYIADIKERDTLKKWKRKFHEAIKNMNKQFDSDVITRVLDEVRVNEDGEERDLAGNLSNEFYFKFPAYLMKRIGNQNLYGVKKLKKFGRGIKNMFSKKETSLAEPLCELVYGHIKKKGLWAKFLRKSGMWKRWNKFEREIRLVKDEYSGIYVLADVLEKYNKHIRYLERAKKYVLEKVIKDDEKIENILSVEANIETFQFMGRNQENFPVLEEYEERVDL